MRIGLLVCALSLLFAPSAAAQTNTFGLSVVRIEGPGGVRTGEDIVNGVNIADCADPAATEITFRVDRAPQNAFFDLWVALVDNCEATSTRTPPSQTCFDINRQVDQLEAQNTFVLTLAELTVGTEGDFDRNPCTEVMTPSGGFYFLHAFDSNTQSTTGELGTLPRDVVGIPIDVAAPNAAEITSGDLAGENVTLKWTAGGGDDDSMLYSFELVNLGACGGGGAQDGGAGGGGGAIGDGGVGAGAVFDTVTGAGSATVNTASDLGLAAGQGALVAIRSIDPAGNVGALSEPVCITNTPSAGFCDVYGMMGGSCSKSCSVAAPGSAARAPMAVIAGFVVALGLAFVRGRRRARSRRFRA